ncbi:MAG: radical SAM protein [Candidatus Omnitrophica bacterium]|nr:radical SAM protein [Candidatus Omnitrophota bacterium]MDD5236285.1 radical SAM protein [Candidatus Omnitrophota bacterium]MDD5610525.1 radical SAM protein [Candidatus Omnitrophota bacterium]
MTFLRNAERFFYKSLKQPKYAFRVGLKRLEASFYYHFGSGRASYPEAITLFLTHKCNLHCKMCGQWGETGVTRKQGTQFIQQELSREEIKAVIDDASRFRPNITLFGGEPLIYPDCADLIRYIKSKKMHCLIITNGFLLEELAQGLVESGLDELNVSLDGNAALHDEIRGMPGLFDKIMRGLAKINYFKEKKARKKPLINLQCTITSYNYRHLEQLVDVARQAKANSLTFHNLIFIDRATLEKQAEFDKMLGCSPGDWEGFNFNPGIDTGLLEKKKKEILSLKHDFSIDFYPNFSFAQLEDYYGNPCYSPHEYSCRCQSPWIVAYVFPDGGVRPCLNSTYSFGNIRELRFTQAWNSDAALKFRNILKKNKMFPACIRCTELYRY